VRFCCPHCDQSYYGTTKEGHLFPTRFSCVNCERTVDMDEMVLRPAGELSDVDTQPQRMPWLERKQRGRFAGFASTIGMSLVKPRPLMRGVPPTASSWQAWWFALVAALVTTLLFMVPMLVLMAVPMFAIGGAGGGPGVGRVAGVFAGMGAFMLVGFPVVTLLYIVGWGLVTHGLLLVTGRRGGTLRHTMQAICYSSGANITTAFPCIGPYLGWIWWLVSAIFMVMESQKVRAVRASIIVSVFPVVFTLLFVSGYVAMIFAAASSAQAQAQAQVGGIQTPMDRLNAQQATRIMQAVRDMERDTGAYPGHGLLLVTDADLSSGDFISSVWNTTRADVDLGDFDLIEFDDQGVTRQGAWAQKVVTRLPKNVVAHRVGDVVFTCHGVAPDDTSTLWLFVMAPDPVANSAGTEETWIVGELSGSVYTVQPSDVGKVLGAQNSLRTEAGLPPLPDPSTITHDAAATAP
jgi:hypothetical protein